MIDCLLAYKQVFEVNNCEKEIARAKSCLTQVKKYQNRIGLLEKLWTENILPVLNNLEIQQSKSDIFLKRRSCKTYSCSLYHIYKKLQPCWNSFYMVMPGTTLHHIIRTHQQARFISGYRLYLFLQSMINRYDLKIKNNDYLIYCPTPFQMMTGTTICTQLDLYQEAFKQLHKLSPRYQTLCKKIFQNELNIERKNAVQVFNTNRKKTPIKNLKMDSKTRYTILPALLKCFSALQDFIPKNNYALLVIHVML
jgi:hypothetical protein